MKQIQGKAGEDIKEGMVCKGGLNPKPSIPRPSKPPKAQAPSRSIGV